MQEAPHDADANVQRTLLFSDVRNGWAFLARPLSGDTRAFATTDGGTTWQALPNAPLFGLQGRWALGATRLVLTGTRPSDLGKASLLSEDGGRTWREMPLAVDDVAPSGLMYGQETLRLRLSTDGGKTARTILEHPAHEGPQVKDLSDPKRLQLMSRTSSGEYEHRSSNDGGLTWTSTPVTFPPGALGITVYHSHLEGDSGWVYATTSTSAGVLLRSVDGGRHWTMASLPSGMNGVRAFRVLGGSVLTLQDHGSKAWISRDGAQSWQPVQPLSDPSQLIELGSAGGGVLHASTGEYKYETSTPCTPPFTSRCTRQETVIHRRYVSTDGGATWRLMPGGLPVTP